MPLTQRQNRTTTAFAPHFKHRALARLAGAFLLFVSCAVASAATPTVQDASLALRKGHAATALEKINAFLVASPKDAQGRFLKGLILTELGRNAEAIQVFAALTDDYPELPEPYNNLAVLYAAQADYEKAKQSLEMAIRTHPSYATAHENLGDIYAKMASQAYDKAMQLDKSNTSAQTKLALIQDLFGPPPAPAPIPEPAPAAVPVSQPAPTAPPAPAAPPPRATVAEDAATQAPDDSGAQAASPDLMSREAVEQTVHAWAAAWSARDVDAYLGFYDREFKTPRGMDIAAWRAQRSERIQRAESIVVELQNLKTQLPGDGTAHVRFVQKYRSNLFSGSDRKKLILVLRDNGWKIQQER